MQSTPRRIAKILIANELMAAILRGDMSGRYISSAPEDLRVVCADWHDQHTIVIYVESETFAAVDDVDDVPLLNVTMTSEGERCE